MKKTKKEKGKPVKWIHPINVCIDENRIISYLFLAILFLSGTMQYAQRQVSQCDIAIDRSNTKVYKNSEGNLVLKTIVRHKPPFGNDDDAWGVRVNIQIPNGSNLLGVTEHSIHDRTLGDISYSGHTLTITGNSPITHSNGFTIPDTSIHLKRAEHMDIECVVRNTCRSSNDKLKFFISAFPRAPHDKDSTDNQLIFIKSCKYLYDGPSVYYARKDFFKILDWDKPLVWIIPCVLVDCPQGGKTTWNKNDVIVFPTGEKRQIQLFYKGKMISASRYNKQRNANELIIPREISKSNSKQFSLRLKS